ncbi:MAG: glycosyltransferase, partial [Planctomycetes bacterium]|nr:glycosyltransferase [Planctomycetota bacterium]
LFTSWHEGAGLVVKEAMACNLPVVSVNVGDVTEVISGVNNCYLISRNPQEMADKVIAILNGNERSNGRESTRRYELSNIAAQIISLYQNL